MASIGRMQERIRSFRSSIQTPVILFPKFVCTFKESVHIGFRQGEKKPGRFMNLLKKKEIAVVKTDEF